MASEGFWIIVEDKLARLEKQRDQARDLVIRHCSVLLGRVQDPSTGEWFCSQCGQKEGHTENCIKGIMEGWEHERPHRD